LRFSARHPLEREGKRQSPDAESIAATKAHASAGQFFLHCKMSYISAITAAWPLGLKA
jgi:hypothetical protein